MKPPSPRRTAEMMLVAWLVAAALPAWGQPAGAATKAVPTNVPVMRMSLPPSPLGLVRQILAMTPDQRQKYLSEKNPRHRKFLEAKLAEFDQLSPEEREARLQSLQLRHYLSLLIRLPATNRQAVLASVPEADRALIQERLKLWDQIRPEQQKLFLEHEAAVRRQVTEDSATPQDPVLRAYTPMDVAQMQRQWNAWNELPPEKRSEIQAQFHQFFSMPPAKKERTLEALDDRKRDALIVLDRLPKEERDQCLQGFQKFAELTPEERHEFLKAAASWKKMSESQRQAWRNLAGKLPPAFPLPPGFSNPPLPPGLKPVRVSHPAVPTPPGE
ncbi:MAG TPA: DUF3106 domain-containing protein [Methylomirabilota bacterium]|nr:DUF3106 domain-containing protein [Methylomirabilota bacterium]